MANEQVDIFINSIIRGSVWLLWTLFFGALQIIIVLVLSLIFSSLSFDFAQLIKDGVYLFIAVSLSSAVMVDYFLRKRNESEQANFVYGVMGFLIIFFSAFIYAALISSPESAELKTLGIVEYVILVFSIVYALVMKAIIYSKDTVRGGEYA